MSIVIPFRGPLPNQDAMFLRVAHGDGGYLLKTCDTEGRCREAELFPTEGDAWLAGEKLVRYRGYRWIDQEQHKGGFLRVVSHDLTIIEFLDADGRRQGIQAFSSRDEAKHQAESAVRFGGYRWLPRVIDKASLLLSEVCRICELGPGECIALEAAAEELLRRLASWEGDQC
jgi:hypothetical protein